MRRPLGWLPLILMIWVLPAWADLLPNAIIDQVFDWPFSTGSNTNCDSTPTISIYEGNEATPSIRNAVNMTQRTAAGRYYYRETFSAANGYEVGKTYHAFYSCVFGGQTRETEDTAIVVASTVTQVKVSTGSTATVVTIQAASGVYSEILADNQYVSLPPYILDCGSKGSSPIAATDNNTTDTITVDPGVGRGLLSAPANNDVCLILPP